MNSIYDIKIGIYGNFAGNAYAHIRNHTNHWCEFCGEDNGGGKFCQNCGKKGTDSEMEDEYELVFCETCCVFIQRDKETFVSCHCCEDFGNWNSDEEDSDIDMTDMLFESDDESDEEN